MKQERTSSILMCGCLAFLMSLFVAWSASGDDSVSAQVDTAAALVAEGASVRVPPVKGLTPEIASRLSQEQLYSLVRNAQERREKEMVPILAIIFFFGTVALVVALPLALSYRKKVLLHRTLRHMVEKGQPIPPEMLVVRTATTKSMLRRGVALVSTGLGIGLFLALFRDIGSGSPGLWAVGLIPGLIGVGHLLVWKLEGKTNGNGKGS